MPNTFITVGSKFPAFSKKSVVSIETGKEFKEVSNSDMEGRWVALFWWPKDFAPVCSTEIAEFNKSYANFTDRNTVLLGASTDSEYVHHAWRKNQPDFHDLSFPIIADTSKSLADALGILSQDDEKVACPATYIIDPEGIVRWLCIHDLSIGRHVGEVLRVLDALQTDELCPCNWQKGEETLTKKLGN